MKDADEKRTRTLSVDDHDVGSNSIGVAEVREGKAYDDEELDLVLDDEELKEIFGILEDCRDCDEELFLVPAIVEQMRLVNPYNNKFDLNLPMQ